MSKLSALVLLCWFVLIQETGKAEEVFHSERHDFVVASLASGLEHPWGMVFIGRGELLITERSGQLSLVNLKLGTSDRVSGLPRIAARGQGGLLDLALHPDFATNRLLYFSFSAAGPGGAGTEVARGRLQGKELHDVEVIFKAFPKSNGGRHFGSRLLFDPQGYLYITLGERGVREQAQTLSTHPGSIVRLHDDGAIPGDNPFVGVEGARPEIFTYGNRNPQGMALQPGTDLIWTHEHGPQGGDEVNVVVAGTNYGWPVITHGRNYGTGTKIGEGTHKEGMQQPLYQWTPSIAPSGMAFYSGDRFPKWDGDLFVGSLKFGLLVRLHIEGGGVLSEERLLHGRFGRIRDVRVGPDGLLYLLTDEKNGQLLRLEPVN